jgi:phage shock protein E
MKILQLTTVLLAWSFMSAGCGSEAPSITSISADEFLSGPPQGAIVLDVRTPKEFSGGHITGAVNIPHDQLASRLEEVGEQTDRPLVVYCERGGRAAKAENVLRSAGYEAVIHLEGDMSAWRSEGRPLVKY